jgi:LmbE family N-acetylglucosaminyl deacetylase
MAGIAPDCEGAHPRHALANYRGPASRLIVLAPHSDDAAFSVAGILRHWLGRSGKATILTCFSRSAYAPRLLLRGADRVSRIRKQEDAAFGAWLPPGCETVWLDWSDAALRGGPDTADVCTSRPLSALELGLAAQLADVLRATVDPMSLVLVPLGLGAHVDHCIVREAGLSLAAAGLTSLFFYEDLPYAAAYALPALHRWIASFSWSRMLNVEPWHVGFADLIDCKQRAALCYPSQVTGKAVARIVGHARRLDPSGPGAERVWLLSYAKTRQGLKPWAESTVQADANQGY